MPPRVAAAPSSGVDRPYYGVLTRVSVVRNEGFDLDCVDTACLAEAGASPTPPRRSCAPRSNKEACDPPGGVDNQIATTTNNHAIKIDTDTYTTAVNRGTRGIMVAVFGWSGADDDDDVNIAIFLSTGSDTPNACEDAGTTEDADTADGGFTLPEGGFFEPRFDGCDRFSVNSAEVTRSIPHVQSKGYVAGRKRVFDAALTGKSLPGWFPLGSRNVETQILKLSATLALDPNGRLSATGVVGGRAAPSALLRAFGQQQSPTTAHVQSVLVARPRRVLLGARLAVECRCDAK